MATKLEEMLKLEGLVAEALAESRYSKATFSAEKFRKLAERASEDVTRHGVLIAQRRGEPIGLAYCNIGEPLVGTGLLITTVQLLYVSASVRGSLLGGKVANSLLNGVLSWGKVRNCEETLVHGTFGSSVVGIEVLMRKRGFVRIGGSYVNIN